MLQGSFNSIFSLANICYSGDGIRTWNEEAVSRCTLFSSQEGPSHFPGQQGSKNEITQ
ncbi:hypothetical protein RHMOL_Rhmol08G0063400 [Rhododendron molle]|nr:hypothetical protein RHMOL_Rhmol08G0063400 [Rhododendron molle]